MMNDPMEKELISATASPAEIKSKLKSILNDLKKEQYL